MRAPSTSTRVCVELVPRVKREVSEPGVPDCTTSRPGTERSNSSTSVFPLFSISLRVMTVMADPTSFSSSGSEVAVTTTDSDTGAGCCALKTHGGRRSTARTAGRLGERRAPVRRETQSSPKRTALPARSAASVFQRKGIAAAKQTASPAEVRGYRLPEAHTAKLLVENKRSEPATERAASRGARAFVAAT